MTLRAILQNSSWALSLLEEVECLYGTQIKLEHDPKLQGEIGVDLSKAIIYYKLQNTLTEDGCVHELFHLKLSKLGCPEILLKRDNEGNKWRIEIPHFLDDIFEHYLFFPELIQQGYSPYTREEYGLSNQLDLILKMNIPQSGHSTQHSFDRSEPEIAFLSIVYARAFLECQSKELQDKCISLFSTPYLSKAKKLGEELLSIVKTHAVADFIKFKIGLDKSIQLLSQSDYMKTNVAA
jgi:hypothetical protein